MDGFEALTQGGTIGNFGIGEKNQEILSFEPLSLLMERKRLEFSTPGTGIDSNLYLNQYREAAAGFSDRNFEHTWENWHSDGKDLVTGIVEGEMPTLQASMQTGENLLKTFATEPDFITNMQMAFGDSFDGNKTAFLAESWKKGELGILPGIEVRSQSEINGAVGGFGAATNKIYLSRELLREGDVGAVASVFLQEYGHYIDSKINPTDAPGDEGEIFSALVKGEKFETQQLQQIKAEDDTATIALDGKLVQIEQTTLGPISGGFEGSQQTIKLGSKDGKGGGTAQYEYEFFQIPDRLIFRYEGKTILDTGFVSGSQTGKVNIPRGNSDELQVILATNDRDTLWNYKINTDTCADPLPLQVSVVSGKTDEKDGKCIAEGTINIGRSDGISAMLKVDGRVEYDDKTISVDGIVSSLIGNVTEPLFQGNFKIENLDKGNTTTSELNDIKGLPGEFKLGGLVDIDFKSLAFNPDGIGLKSEFTLPEGLGKARVVLDGNPNSFLIGRDGISLGGGKVSLPSGLFEKYKLFGNLLDITTTDLDISYIPAEKALKLQGKLVAEPITKQGPILKLNPEITLDLAGDNYIQIKDGKLGIKGAASVKNFDLPGGWGLNELSLSVDTDKRDVALKTKINFPFAPRSPIPPVLGGGPQAGRAGGVEVGFKLAPPKFELNGISLEADNLNVAISPPIPPLGLNIFLQRVKLGVNNLAESAGEPIEGIGGLGLTYGPKVLVPVGQEVDKFLGIPNPIEGALFALEGDVRISSERFAGNGKVTIINDLVANVQGNVEYNWKNDLIKIGGNAGFFNNTFSGSANITTNTKTLDTNGYGAVKLKIPDADLFGFLRNRDLASGNFQFQFRNNSSTSDDFITTWGRVNLPLINIGFTEIGTRFYYLEGKVELFGDKPIPKTNSFRVDPGTEYILLGADWDNPIANAPIQVIAPNGTVFNESDFAATGKIAVVEDLTGAKTKAVIVVNPEPGIWDIKLTNPTDLGNVRYTALRDSIAPTIQVTAPATDVSGQNTSINYNAFDADSNAKVSLFYDTDNQGFDGILIADNLAETDGAGSFVWNAEGVPTGDYYVYAMVMDENNAPVFSYSPGRVRVTQSADLSVTKTASSDPVIVGNNLTYTIAVTNNGSSNANGVILTDTLPEGVTFVSASLTPTKQSGNDLTFDLGNLNNGESKTVNVTVTPTTAGIITGIASVTGKTYDPDVANDVAILATTVDTPTATLTDIAIATTTNPAPLNLGDNITYNLTVTNNSSTKATGVTLKNNLPSGLKDILIASSKGAKPSENNGVVTANLGDLNSGETATVTVTANSIAAGNLISTASVTSNETDSNLANNSIIEARTVNAVAPTPADLELTKTANNTSPTVGDQITFNLTLTNKGPGVASSVKVTDLLPSGLSFVSADSIQGTYDPVTGVWDVGNMRDNLSRTLNIVARVDSIGSFITTAAVTAANETDPDSTPGNNNPNEDDQASVAIATIGGNGGLRLVFDEPYYLAQHSDVKAAVEKRKFKNGFSHFVRHGEKEDRDFRVWVFDESYYLEQNPDVKAAVEKRKFRSGLRHFIRHGQFEGRLPNSFNPSAKRLLFDEDYYLEQNPDVKESVERRDFRTGFAHFIEWGQIEGRLPSPLGSNLLPG